MNPLRIEFSEKPNTKNSGCEQKGLHLDIGAKIGAGLVEGLSGSGKISDYVANNAIDRIDPLGIGGNSGPIDCCA